MPYLNIAFVGCENKIACIKIVRTVTGMGLKEAKDFVENGMGPHFTIQKLSVEFQALQGIKAQLLAEGASFYDQKGNLEDGSKVYNWDPEGTTHWSGPHVADTPRQQLVSRLQDCIKLAAESDDFEAVEVLSIARRSLMLPVSYGPASASS